MPVPAFWDRFLAPDAPSGSLERRRTLDRRRLGLLLALADPLQQVGDVGELLLQVSPVLLQPLAYAIAVVASEAGCTTNGARPGR
jgi:hypothetical protein